MCLSPTLGVPISVFDLYRGTVYRPTFILGTVALTDEGLTTEHDEEEDYEEIGIYHDAFRELMAFLGEMRIPESQLRLRELEVITPDWGFNLTEIMWMCKDLIHVGIGNQLEMYLVTNVSEYTLEKYLYEGSRQLFLNLGDIIDEDTRNFRGVLLSGPGTAEYSAWQDASSEGEASEDEASEDGDSEDETSEDEVSEDETSEDEG